MNTPPTTESATPAEKGLSTAQQVGIMVWFLGAIMLFDWSWQATMGLAFIYVGSNLAKPQKPADGR